MHIFEVKSQLAKLLAMENITMMHAPGEITASFDLKNRVLRLPVWDNISEDLYDMLVVHEVGHALDTPFERWMEDIDGIASRQHPTVTGPMLELAKRSIRGFVNVVEDARIDKRQKRRYPGSVRNYAKGYQELRDRDFFGLEGKDINKLLFIDRANIYFKNGTLLGIKFTDEEQAFIDRMATTETFEEVVVLSEDIYAWSRKNNSLPDEMTTDIEIEIVIAGDGDTGEESGSKPQDGDTITIEVTFDGEGDYDEGPDGKGAEGQDGEKKEEEDNNPSKESKEKKDDDKGNSSKKPARGAGEVDENFIPQSETYEAAERNAKEIISSVNEEYIYANMPFANIDTIVDDWKKVLEQANAQLMNLNTKNTEIFKKIKDSLARWRKNEVDAINFMVKEFEMKKAADAYQRSSIAKTGVIDTNKLHTFKYNEDIFRKQTVIPQGKNHGLVILLDWSGSMNSNLKDSLSQLFSIVLFCKRVQIPFDVYIFRSFCREDQKSINYPQQWNDPSGKLDINFGAFKLRNVLSSQMPIDKLNTMMLYMWSMNKCPSYYDPLNSTPLNQAAFAFSEVVNTFKKKTKVQIVSTVIITDGDSDGFQVNVFPKRYGAPSTTILRDPVTKEMYPITNYGKSRNTQTSAILKMLKKRTQTAVIGFFLQSGNLSRYDFRGDEKEFEEENKRYNTEKYAISKSQGYDEYYIVDVRGSSKRGDFDVDSSMSANKIAKSFTEFSEKKKANRRLLSRFIDKISKELS